MISVITPVFNGERFIGECIEVVLKQNAANIEHIIMDGGSSDGTVEIIRRYAQAHPHIRWESSQDRGQSDAMNKAIALARGEVLAILNVDDFYAPDVLNRVSTLFETLPEPTFLAGNCNILDDDGNLIEIIKPSRLTLYELLQDSPVMPFPRNPTAYFYHKSLHDRVGPYGVADHYTMDLDFILRAVQVAHLKYIDELWGHYRFLTGTKSHTDYTATRDGYRRRYRVFKYYRKDLKPFQRVKVALLYVYNHLLYWKIHRLRQCLGNTREITVTLNNKIQAISHSSKR